MVNLWVLYLVIVTSFGLKVNGGISIDANFRVSGISFGYLGFSSEIPLLTINRPFLCKYTAALYPIKNSKSAWRLLAGFGESTTTPPVPVNTLASKWNDAAVIWSISVIDTEVPAVFCTVGRKSKQSLSGKVPVGSVESGSTFVPVYTGILSYSICPLRGLYESTVNASPEPCSR